jgi:hypothetical protein
MYCGSLNFPLKNYYATLACAVYNRQKVPVPSEIKKQCYGAGAGGGNILPEPEFIGLAPAPGM